MHIMQLRGRLIAMYRANGVIHNGASSSTARTGAGTELIAIMLTSIGNCARHLIPDTNGHGTGCRQRELMDGPTGAQSPGTGSRRA